MPDRRKRPERPPLEDDDGLAGPGLPEGVDGDALMDGWLGIADAMSADGDAAAEEAEIRRRLDRVELDARRAEAYRLKVGSHLTYRQIGERMGCDPKTAWRLVDAFAKVAVPVSEREVAFRESLETREALLRRALAIALNPDAETDDVLRAVTTADRLVSSIDRLYGLDRPEAGVDPGTITKTEDADRALIELEDRMQQLRELGLMQARGRAAAGQ